MWKLIVSFLCPWRIAQDSFLWRHESHATATSDVIQEAIAPANCIPLPIERHEHGMELWRRHRVACLPT
jgi:hypothetical protein